MKNKVLIIIAIVLFIMIMIILSKYLNNLEINNIQESDDSKVEIAEVTYDNFEEEVLNCQKTVVIDFYADWCQPCKVYSPIIEEFATENEDIKVVKINVDDSQDLAIKYNVISIPTTVIIKDSKEINRTVGIVNKSDLEQIIK